MPQNETGSSLPKCKEDVGVWLCGQSRAWMTPHIVMTAWPNGLRRWLGANPRGRGVNPHSCHPSYRWPPRPTLVRMGFDALLRMLARIGWGSGWERRRRRAQVGTTRWPATCQDDAECKSLRQHTALRWCDIGPIGQRRTWQRLRFMDVGSARLRARVPRQVGCLALGCWSSRSSALAWPRVP